MPPGSLFMHLLPPTKNHQPRLPWHEGTPWSWHTHAPGDLLRQGLHPTAPGSCDNAPRVRCCRHRVWTCWNGGFPSGSEDSAAHSTCVTRPPCATYYARLPTNLKTSRPPETGCVSAMMEMRTPRSGDAQGPETRAHFPRSRAELSGLSADGLPPSQPGRP